MSAAAAAITLLIAAGALLAVIGAAWRLAVPRVATAWQPLARSVAAFTAILLVPGLVAVAGLLGLSSRVAAEAVLIAQQPRSDAYEHVALYLVGDATRLPWHRPDAAVDARWLVVEVTGLPWGRFDARLDSRALAPPGVQLTGSEAHPHYPINADTFPELLRAEAGLYPDDASRAELAAVADAMRWLAGQRSIEPDDAGDNPDAHWRDRHQPALAEHFDQVRLRPPRVHNEPADPRLATRPLLVLASLWALGLVPIALTKRPLTFEVRD